MIELYAIWRRRSETIEIYENISVSHEQTLCDLPRNLSWMILLHVEEISQCGVRKMSIICFDICFDRMCIKKFFYNLWITLIYIDSIGKNINIS